MPKERRVTVAITLSVSKETLQAIQSVSPRLDVRYIGEEVRTEYRLRTGGRTESAEYPQVRKTVDDALRDTEVALCSQLPERLFDRAPNLRWVQSSAAGVDQWISRNDLARPVVFTDASGAAAVSLAEAVFAFMLALARGFNHFIHFQLRHEWARREVPSRSIEGKTLGIIGVGAIGTQVARLGKAFHMHVLGSRRSQARREHSVGDVDEMLPPSDLHELLERSDFVVLALPLTPESKHLVDEAALQRMKPTAYLINVSRGGVVDEKALVRALKRGTIAGAGLDVFSQEPLPAESELWGLPNVILTPHQAGGMEDYMLAVAEKVFCENLRRYLTGEELMNIVSPTLGY